MSQRKNPTLNLRGFSPKSRSRTPTKNNNTSASKNHTASPTRGIAVNNFTSASGNQDYITIRKCRNLMCRAEDEILIKELAESRLKLIPCLEIYDLLHASNMPQRCLQHNNVLSLYCLNEHRLLCVNCVYGTHKHRTHRINPLKESMDDVRKVNNKLENDLMKQYQHLKNQLGVAQNNVLLLESTLNHMLVELEKEFDAISQQLTAKYIEIKKGLVESFNEAISKHHIISDEFSWIAGTTQATVQRLPKDADQQEELRKNLLLLKFLEVSGLRVKPVVQEEMDGIRQDLFKQIQKVSAMIEKHKWIRF